MPLYQRLIELLMELIGAHPRPTWPDEHFIAVLRSSGWRPFLLERVK